MEYLCYIKPPTDVCKAIAAFAESMKQSVQGLPVLNLHCTLLHTYIDETRQDEAVSSLEGIAGRKIQCETGSLAMFDNDKLVVRLNNNQHIRGLHLQLLDSLDNHVDRQNLPPIHHAYRNDVARSNCYRIHGSCYVNRFYNPHISVCEVKAQQDMEYLLGMFGEYLTGIRWVADSFRLARRENGKWKDVRQFVLV
jgi:2'-5' RNA ligase